MKKLNSNHGSSNKVKFTLAIIIFISIVVSNNANSQDYYYYSGSRIDLEKRHDKIAVILNSNSFVGNNVKNILRDIVSSTDEIKQAGEYIYLVKFEREKSESEVMNYISRISQRIDLVKFVTPVYYGQSKEVSEFPTDEFIVRLRNIYDKEKLDFLNSQNSINIVGNINDEKGFLLKSDDGINKNALELSDIYFKTGLFEYAEPNFAFPEYCLLNSDPNDAFYGQQWALNNTGQAAPTNGITGAGDQPNANGIDNSDMDVNLAWDITLGSSSVKVAVFDSGVDSTHPELLGQLLTGYDAATNTYGVANDPNGHGTCCVGIITAKRNNSLGTAGIAPGCKVMAVNIIDAFGTLLYSYVARGYDTARIKNIDIFSNSFGGGTPFATLDNAIINAATNGRGGLGCIMLFASGNDGMSFPSYPSNRSQVICVGASTPTDQKKAPGTGNQYWWGGNYGESGAYDLDVVAPTVCYATDVQGTGGHNTAAGAAGNYDSTFNGTSCSCPNAAGVAALILSVNTALNGSQVFEYLARGCNKIDNADYSKTKTYGRWNNYLGYGRVNAFNSVRLAAGVDVTPPTINHNNVASHSSTYPTKILAEILDQDGSLVSASSVKIFYRINKNNAGWSAYDSLSFKSSSGNIYTFEIPSLGYQNEVQYYISAKDNSGNKALFPGGAPNSFKVCNFSVGTYQTDTKKIPAFNTVDNGVAFSPTVNYGNFNIVNAKAQIHVAHATVQDLVIELYSPNGNSNINRIALFSRNGAGNVSTANINGSIVTDSSNLYWYNLVPPYTSAFVKPDYYLKTLNGTNANGNWSVIVRDIQNGVSGIVDSIKISLMKLSGTTSPCARLDSPVDSILNFGMITPPDSIDKNFYIKNVGTANLNVTNVSFSGQIAAMYSLVSALPAPIVPNDSGLIIARFKSSGLNRAGSGIDPTDANSYAVMNIVNNDPSKPVFKVSLQNDNSIGNKSLSLHLFIQGFFYNFGGMPQDTIRVYLRTFYPPYSVADSSKIYMSSTGTGTAYFPNGGIDNVNYYYQIIHRNALETWSKTPQPFISGAASYDFTTSANKAFGDNQIQVGPSAFAFYSGDIIKDGFIDLDDLIGCYNNALDFASGYLPGDINYDGIVDLSDLVVVYNNAQAFIHLVRP